MHVYKKKFITGGAIFVSLLLFGMFLYRTTDNSNILRQIVDEKKYQEENQDLAKGVLGTTSATFYAVEDSYVRDSSPNTNYGSASSLQVDNYNNNIYSYLKFDLTPLAGKTITSARFHLRLDPNSPMLGGYLRSVSDTSWKESTITWNNKPALGSTLVGIFNAETDSWITDPNWVHGLDITSYVNSKKGNFASLGIAMSSSYNTSSYKSRETADKPNIVVIYDGTPISTPTPTPTSIPALTSTPTPTPVSGNNIANLNFGITDLKPWVQSICGDIRIDDGIENPVPAGYHAFITNGSCTTPGIAFSGDSSYSFGQGDISTTNRIVGGTVYPEAYTSSSGIFSSYANLNNDVMKTGITATDLASICTLSNCTLPANLPHGVYIANTNVALNAFRFPANQNYVFLINGSLTIRGNVLVPSGSSSVFSASNDIIVDSSVSRIEGTYSADRSFIVNSFNNCTDVMLTIAGSVIANAGLIGGSFQNNRDLCSEDSTSPTISFVQRLDFLFSLPTFMRSRNTYSWEAAP